METYSYPAQKFNIGDTFSITHCDGYVANEKVYKVEYYGCKYYYVCESCAVYSDDNF